MLEKTHCLYPDLERQITDWINTRTTARAVLLLGSPGVGKTTLAHRVCETTGLKVLEFNASHTRSGTSFRKVIVPLLREGGIMRMVETGKKGGIGILLDEIDGLSNGERGGLQELLAYLKSPEALEGRPLILISNTLDTRALQQLGVGAEQSTNLVDAVTENRKKELARLKREYDFKASNEYRTPQAKEEALANQKAKIDRLEEQIKSIRERIENFQKEICPICFDEPQDALLTKCCQRVFCAACILQSLARKLDCPLCRKTTNPSDLKRITADGDANTMVVPVPAGQPPLKKDALIKLFQENPTGKFLVFSRYDNPFLQITSELEAVGINGIREVKGTKDVIQATLNSFQKGTLRCLLLNSLHAGAGLTITAATHIILLHAMNIEEEKQILGRAYRLGRKEPLNVYKLVHQDEMDVAV